MALKCGLSYTIDGIESKYVNNMESIERFRYFGLQNKVNFSPLKKKLEQLKMISQIVHTCGFIYGYLRRAWEACK